MSRSRLAVLAVATFAAGTTACSALLDWSEFTGGAVGVGTDGGTDGDATTTDSSTDGPAMGGDATDSATPDAVVSCGDGGVCAPMAPSGWMGPVALYTGAGTAPACAGGATSLFDGMGMLMAPPATCSSCSCDAASVSCATPVVSIYEAPSCSGTASTTVTPATSCTMEAQLFAAMVSVAPPALSGCAPGTSTPTLTPPSWGMVARACPVTGTGGCSGTESCIPARPSSTSVCVMQPGTATACPAGYPSGPQTFYTGVNDSRGCSACTCSTPSGATCAIASPAVDTYQNPGCGTPDAMLSANNSCTTVAGDLYLELVATPTLTGAPSCVAGGGTPTGMATGDPATATSFCCLP